MGSRIPYNGWFRVSRAEGGLSCCPKIALEYHRLALQSGVLSGRLALALELLLTLCMGYATLLPNMLTSVVCTCDFQDARSSQGHWHEAGGEEEGCRSQNGGFS